MKKPQKPNFLEWNRNVLISSIKKIDLNIILIVILDFLFYSLSGYIIILWLQRAQEKMAAFTLPADVLSLGYRGVEQLVSEAKAFYYLLIFSFIVLLIAIIFLASLLKGVIWAKTTNTRLTLALISKFLALNLVWMSFWFIVVILISVFALPASAPILMAITIILGIYFTNTLYAIFMHNRKFSSIKDAIKLNVKKIHLFLIPYVVFIALLFIIVVLSSLIKLDRLLLVVTVKLGDLIGANYSYTMSNPAAGLLIDPKISIIFLTSILINPFLLLLFGILRYYISALVFEMEKL